MEILRHWRLKAQRYRLEGSVCQSCGQTIFPPRAICPRCTARVAQEQLPGHFLGTQQLTFQIRKDILRSIGMSLRLANQEF